MSDKEYLRLFRKSFFLTALISCLFSVPAYSSAVCFKGVNLSGAEYGVNSAGIYGTNYIYPSENTVRYFASKGMNMVRLPFRWERLQPVLGGPLDAVELDRLKSAVELLRKYGLKTVLNPHNFGYYFEKKMMTPDLPSQAFTSFWIRVAIEFGDQEDIIFGLMNEPYDIPVEDWLAASNQAIAGIRNVGASNMILVPGTNWSGAATWFSDWQAGNNSKVMPGVVDPENNFVFEVHQYMDEDFSGTHETCPRAEQALTGLRNFTAWLAERGAKGFLGEFGGSKNPVCLKGIVEMVQHMDANSEQWIGWTYWAAGEWWPESEGNNIQPVEGRDRPQLSELLPFMQKADPQNCSTLN